VNDVWGVKTFNNVFRYNPVSRTFNSEGGNTAQVTAGGDGVWIVDTSDHVWRFDSSSASFVQVPGVLKGLPLDLAAAFLESILQIRSSPSSGRRRCEGQQMGALFILKKHPEESQGA
jgi:Tectonin domain